MTSLCKAAEVTGSNDYPVSWAEWSGEEWECILGRAQQVSLIFQKPQITWICLESIHFKDTAADFIKD